MVIGENRSVKSVLNFQAIVLELLKANTNYSEIWLRDPDGYTVVLASAYGDVGTP